MVLAVTASSYLELGLLVRGMVQEDLHRPKMPIRSSHVESRGPLLSEKQPYKHTFHQHALAEATTITEKEDTCMHVYTVNLT